MVSDSCMVEAVFIHERQQVLGLHHAECGLRRLHDGSNSQSLFQELDRGHQRWFTLGGWSSLSSHGCHVFLLDVADGRITCVNKWSGCAAQSSASTLDSMRAISSGVSP